MKRKEREFDDPYLDELKYEFKHHSFELKKLKQKFLKSNSVIEQSKIIKKVDSIARAMETNQQQAKKVTKSRIKERKAKAKR